MRTIACVVSVVVSLGLFSGGEALASKPLEEGTPGFGIALYLPCTSVEGGGYELTVDCWSVRHPGGTIGEVGIEFPPGIDVLSGDTKRRVHPSAQWDGPIDCPWKIRFRVNHDGAYELRASFTIGSRSQSTVDETDCVLKFQFQDNVISWGERYATRFEHLEGGQRFRYGGKYMVAIDGPEAVLAEHVVQGPRPITSRSGVCQNCGQAGSRSVHFVVTVGKDGRVRWVRPSKEWEPGGDARIQAAAHQAIRDWIFRPALTDMGVPVDGWAEVDVRVEVTN